MGVGKGRAVRGGSAGAYGVLLIGELGGGPHGDPGRQGGLEVVGEGDSCGYVMSGDVWKCEVESDVC